MNPIFMYVVWSTIAVAAMLSAIVLLRLMIGLGPLIQRLEVIADWLEAGRPQYVKILEDLEAQLGELRGISESVHNMVETAENFTAGVRSAAQPIVREIQDFSRTARHAHALLAAVRIGMNTFFLHRRDAVCGPDPSNEVFQES